ncbi:hypothetical protein ACJMK2_034111, partial [Sinanodonta woodiana]
MGNIMIIGRRKTTKREWNFVHNLDTIASSSLSISKISPRAECIITSPPHFHHPGSVNKKKRDEPVVTSSFMTLQLPSNGTLVDDEDGEDEFDEGDGEARVQKDSTSNTADEHPAADDSDLSHKDMVAESSVKPELDNVMKNMSASEIPENTAAQQRYTMRQRLTSNRSDDSSSVNGMFTKDVSASIMGSTPKPGKEQRSRKKMVSLSQYQISVSEQIEEEEKRKQEPPNQNTQMALKQDIGNKFYRTISTQDYNLTSDKSSSKSNSGLSKQSSSKKMEELHLEETKENSKYSLKQNSLRKRLRSHTPDKGQTEAEKSQPVLKQESQAKRLKSVGAEEKKVVAVKSQVPDQHKSVQRQKWILSNEKADAGKEVPSKQKKKETFSVQPISPTSQNITQSTPLSLKYNKEHERVEVKQQDEKLKKKKTVAMKNSVGACAVYMWNAGDMKRGAKDVTDLDVALDCIIKTLEFERYFSHKHITQGKMIQKQHYVRKMQSSIRKKNSQILHLRKELLKIQKKRFRQIGDAAKGKRDNSARNAQKISNSLAQLEAFVKEMPSRTMMEMKNSKRLVQL